MSPGSSSSRLSFLCKFFTIVLAISAFTAACEAQDKVELFGGYSYVHASVQVNQISCGSLCLLVLPPLTQHANLNGWNFSGQYKFLPFLGVVADFNGTYGTLDSVGTREHTFLFGPQISLPAKVSPFAHALFGAAKESQDPIPPPPGPCPLGPNPCSGFLSLGADRSFATALGAGIDVKLIPFVKLRLFQIDYVRTQLHGATQNQPRVSAGVVFHF
ncbi:MAG TPA: hypothetical protein VMH48_11595 [Methylomirabilota bacterium]|nr:hypothetical protein [Methylomirabilota bacterium]